MKLGPFVDMCIEFFYSTNLKLVVDGVLNPSHMNYFVHARTLLMFFIFGVAMLVNKKIVLDGVLDHFLKTKSHDHVQFWRDQVTKNIELQFQWLSWTFFKSVLNKKPTYYWQHLINHYFLILVKA